MLIGENIQPTGYHIPNPQAQMSPEQAVQRKEHQNTAVERLHNGHCSAGKMEDIAEQVHRLTSLPCLSATQPKIPKHSKTCCNNDAADGKSATLPKIEIIPPHPGACCEGGASDSSDNPQMASLAVLHEPVPPSLPRQEVSRPRRRQVSTPFDSSSSSEATVPTESEHRFQCHPDLFSTVLTPRSRGRMSLTPLNRRLHKRRVSEPQAGEPARCEEHLRPRRNSESCVLKSQAPRLLSPLRDQGSGVPSPSTKGPVGTPTVHTGQFSVCSKKKMRDDERQQACEALRFLVFAVSQSDGSLGGSTLKKNMNAVSLQIDDYEQSNQFYEFWVDLDPHMTGETEGHKFQSSLSHLETLANIHRLRSQRIASLLVNRETGHIIVEDVMCAIWPQSTPAEKAALWFRMLHEHQLRQNPPIPEPPLLPEQDSEALARIFAELDKPGTGRVSWKVLAETMDDCERPLVDPDIVQGYAEAWDKDGMGSFTLQDFLMMMCPAGFRAFGDAQSAMDESGVELLKSPSGNWRYRSNPQDA